MMSVQFRRGTGTRCFLLGLLSSLKTNSKSDVLLGRFSTLLAEDLLIGLLKLEAPYELFEDRPLEVRFLRDHVTINVY